MFFYRLLKLRLRTFIVSLSATVDLYGANTFYIGGRFMHVSTGGGTASQSLHFSSDGNLPWSTAVFPTIFPPTAFYCSRPFAQDRFGNILYSDPSQPTVKRSTNAGESFAAVSISANFGDGGRCGAISVGNYFYLPASDGVTRITMTSLGSTVATLFRKYTYANKVGMPPSGSTAACVHFTNSAETMLVHILALNGTLVYTTSANAAEETWTGSTHAALSGINVAPYGYFQASGNGKYVILAAKTTIANGFVGTFSAGVWTWSNYVLGFNPKWMHFDGINFVAMSTVGIIYTSEDGLTWQTSISMSPYTGYIGATSGNGKSVVHQMNGAVGVSGSQMVTLTSSNG